MGRKKFNKKDASVYHLVRRSQNDVGGYFDKDGKPIDMPSDFVLIPSEDTLKRAEEKQQKHVLENNQNDDDADDELTKAKKKLAKANLLDDYDYDKHMAPITGDGVFIPNNDIGEVDFYTNEIRSKKLDLIDPMIKEVDRQLTSIALTPDCMDDDVAQALFGDYDEGGFEDILDDFCFTANQDVPIHEMNQEEEGGLLSGGGAGGFDFDAHVDALIAKAKLEDNGGPKIVPKNHKAWLAQQDVFKSAKPLRRKHDDDLDSIDEGDEEDSFDRQLDYFTMEENPGIVAKLDPSEEKALCEKFEQTLLEYDSDELGDLDEECYDIKGDKPLEGDVHIEAVLDKFIQEKKDENFVMGAPGEKREGGSSRVYINKKMVPYNMLDKIEGEIDEAEEEKVDVLAEADEVLAVPEMDLPPEEVLIDGKSYFTMKEQNPWDCESILSTYSNMDNNPSVVGRSGRRRNKKKKNKNRIDFDQESIAEERPVQILLSDKTGLPLGILPGPKDFFDDQEEETFASVNKGAARKKGETKEEKKARKLLVKQERQVSRIQKKMMREAIQEEFGLRAHTDVSNDVGGKSVFKYS
jgi:protein LTV1